MSLLLFRSLRSGNRALDFDCGIDLRVLPSLASKHRSFSPNALLPSPPPVCDLIYTPSVLTITSLDTAPIYAPIPLLSMVHSPSPFMGSLTPYFCLLIRGRPCSHTTYRCVNCDGTHDTHLLACPFRPRRLADHSRKVEEEPMHDTYLY